MSNAFCLLYRIKGNATSIKGTKEKKKKKSTTTAAGDEEHREGKEEGETAMGAGGSTQAGASAGAAASDSEKRKAHSSLTTMKKTPIAPLPTAFDVVDFNPLVHASLSAKSIGVVLSAEALCKRAVGEIPLPPSVPVPAATAQEALADSGRYRWFAEDLDRMGHWEPYNSESSQRLESAFMERKESCLVVWRKRTYTVDLKTMQQLPEGVTSLPTTQSWSASGTQMLRTKRVKRAAADVVQDPLTGGEKVEMRPDVMVDPFGDEAENSVSQRVADSTAGVGAGESAPSCASHAENKMLPRLDRLAYPSADPLYSLDFSPSEATHILSGGKDSRLVEWDTTTGAVTTRYAITASKPTFVLVARYSPSGKLVVCGCDDNVGRVYRAGTCSPVHMLKGHTHKVYGASFMAGERRLVTGSMDAHLRVWDLETGACLTAEQTHTSHIFSVLSSKYNEGFCVSAGNDAVLCAHDMRCPNSVVMRMKGHSNTLWDVGIFPGDGGENHQLASAGMDGTTRLWDPRQPHEALLVLSKHARPVHSICYMPNGKGILSTGKDSYVFLSDTTSGELVWRAKAQMTSVFRVVYQAERREMATSGAQGLVNLWEWPLGEVW